jgi:ribosomal protein S18 acetylase RimI-like enzyme
MALRDDDLEQPLPLRPAIDGSDIRNVAHDDVPTLAKALARAFEDDPVMSWVFADPSGRPRRLERGFTLFLRKIWLPRGECYTMDRVFGGALWLPPNRWHLGAGAQLRLLPRMIGMAGRDLVRLASVLQMIERKHPSKPPHYYLAVLGVEPELQGRGFGSALMQPVLERCDRDRIPAYLESSKRRNVVLYERHGFKVTEQVRAPRGGPPMWLMWREPSG